MSDYTPATLQLFFPTPPSKKVRQEIANLLSDYSFLLDWSDVVTPETVKDGASFGSDSAPLGIVEDLGSDLDQYPVNYRLSSDARYEYDGCVRYRVVGRPALNFFATQTGEPLVPLKDVRDALRSLHRALGDPERWRDEKFGRLDGTPEDWDEVIDVVDRVRPH